ncbi:putative F-box protein At3g16210 [Lathyrus oleraceus]|uniref:putative F-box protein At3g16210 n=1 Tax=Pisum sativum TaxID=3888 RepID=UPI001FC652D5|nr:putative F-box protein At3g16210 [Pisum sativum]
MEKYAAARNEKVRNFIPDDLAFSILSNLSLKPLKRFECVCKSWNLLFENPYFISLYQKKFLSNNQLYYDDKSLLIHQTMYDDDGKFILRSLSGERFEKMDKLNWPNPFKEDDPGFEICGSSSINGIFCLICYSQPNIRVVLWNPATGEFKVVPNSPIEIVPYMNIDIIGHGFGYDCVGDDYKVIRRVLCSPKIDDYIMSSKDISYDPFWETYNLKSNTWKKLEFNYPVNYEKDGVFLAGVFHWWGENIFFNINDDEEEEEAAYLLSFNLNTEVFTMTGLPLEDNTSDFEYMCRDLMVLNGSIALLSNYSNVETYPSNDNFYIYILGELGVKDSWFKLFTIQPLPCIDFPIGAGKKGDILFIKEDGKLAYFDLTTEMIEELGFVGDTFRGKTIIYKEDLLPIGEINK